jgi:hypothetical protein
MLDEIWFDAGIECPVEIRVALGKAPVFTTKELRQHELMFKTFAQLVKPRDFVEWIFVRECADNRVEALRLKRLNIRLVQTPLINHLTVCCRELASADKVKIEKLREKRSAELASKIKELKGTSAQVEAETARLQAEANEKFRLEIEEIKFENHKRFKEQQEPIIKEELTDADFFDEWIGPYERVSKRIAILDENFASLLEQLDQWRHGGLGERLRKAASDIIEGECKEELDPLAVQQTEVTQTSLAPAKGADAQRSPEGSQVQTTPCSPGGAPEAAGPARER